MSGWKKVIVSGSNAHLTSITSSVLTNTYIPVAGVGGALSNSSLTLSGTTLNLSSNSIISTGTSTHLTGSFSGSFKGDGSGLSNVLATGVNIFPLSNGLGIEDFSYKGASSQSITLDTGSSHFTSGVRNKISSSNTTGPSGINLNYNPSTGVINGSLVHSSLTLSADSGTNDVVNLGETLNFAGTPKEINTTVSDNKIQIGLPNDVTIANNLTVNNDLTVLGTASFQEIVNLDVADRFIRLASGSNATGDGGIAVQQSSSLVSEVFGYDSSTFRWGVTSSFDATSSSFSPDAFISLAIEGTGIDPTLIESRYQAKGNIFISSTDEVWIYA